MLVQAHYKKRVYSSGPSRKAVMFLAVPEASLAAARLALGGPIGQSNGGWYRTKFVTSIPLTIRVVTGDSAKNWDAEVPVSAFDLSTDFAPRGRLTVDALLRNPEVKMAAEARAAASAAVAVAGASARVLMNPDLLGAKLKRPMLRRGVGQAVFGLPSRLSRAIAPVRNPTGRGR